MSDKKVEDYSTENEIELVNNKPYKKMLTRYLYGFLSIAILFGVMLWLYYTDKGIYNQKIIIYTFISFITSLVILLGVLILLHIKKTSKFIIKHFEKLDLTRFILMTITIMFFIQIFLITIMDVEGSSMEPVLHHSDKVLVNRLPLKVNRDDIIVIKVGPQYQIDNKDYFVKRIKGLPGDKITYQENIVGEQITLLVYVNNELVFSIDEILSVNTWKDLIDDNNNLIPDNKYLLLGDNYLSYDSKYFGYVNKEDLKGKVWFRIFNEFGVIK